MTGAKFELAVLDLSPEAQAQIGPLLDELAELQLGRFGRDGIRALLASEKRRTKALTDDLFRLINEDAKQRALKVSGKVLLAQVGGELWRQIALKLWAAQSLGEAGEGTTP